MNPSYFFKYVHNPTNVLPTNKYPPLSALNTLALSRQYALSDLVSFSESAMPVNNQGPLPWPYPVGSCNTIASTQRIQLKVPVLQDGPKEYSCSPYLLLLTVCRYSLSWFTINYFREDIPLETNGKTCCKKLINNSSSYLQFTGAEALSSRDLLNRKNPGDCCI